MSDNRKIIKGASLVGSLTAVSRIFGLLRDMITAGYFGAGPAADAFFVAFRIPNVLRRLFAEGALTVSFVPIFKETQIREGKAAAKTICDVIFTFVIVVLALVVISGMAFAPFLVRAIAPGFGDPEKYELTVYLTRITFPYIFLICLVALAMGILNSLGRFAAPAAAPVLLNISIIAAVVFISPFLDEPAVSLAVGVVFGGILQVLLQVPYLNREGYLPSFNFGFSHPAIRRLVTLMTPAIFGIAVYQLNIFTTTIIASLLPEGSVSYLYYADRFYQLPLGIFVISMATAVLPTMSEQVATGRLEEMRNSVSFALRVIFFITLPATAGLIAVSIPVFSLFFQRGEFGYDDTVRTAAALQYYAIGLCAVGGVKIVVPAFYAMQDMKSPVRVAFIAFVANIILSLVLMVPLLHAGLALATSISSVLNLILLLLILKKRVGRIIDGLVIMSFLKSLAGSAVVFITAYGICSFGDWRIDGMKLEKAAIIMVSAFSGVVVYLFSSFLTRSEEIRYIIRALRKKRGS